MSSTSGLSGPDGLLPSVTSKLEGGIMVTASHNPNDTPD